MNTVTEYTIDTNDSNSSFFQAIPRRSIRGKNTTSYGTALKGASVALMGLCIPASSSGNNITINPIPITVNTIGFQSHILSKYIDFSFETKKIMPQKKIKAKLKQQYTSDDSGLMERLNKCNSSSRVIVDKAFDDLDTLIDANSGKLINGLERWL